MFFDKILTKPFLVTIVRYALVAAGAWLVSNGYLSEEVWQQVLGGLTAIILALMGASESVKDKVVQDGKAIDTSKLPIATRNEIKDAVETKKGRTVLDMLFGK